MKTKICPKLYSAPLPTYIFHLQVKVTDVAFLCLRFVLDFFEIPIIQCVCSMQLVFDMMIDICAQFYSVPHPPMHVTYRLMSQTSIFVLFQMFKILNHPNLLFSLVSHENILDGSKVTELT